MQLIAGKSLLLGFGSADLNGEVKNHMSSHEVDITTVTYFDRAKIRLSLGLLSVNNA